VHPAAFFDLDRTLISRATPLALANSFRRRRLVRRRDLVRAALWQLVFLVRGVGEREVRRAAEDGMRLLRGVPVAAVEDLLAEAMERVLRPLVYRESLELVRLHHERGEQVYLVSASLQQIVERVADDLGLDGAVGSTCEVEDGVYTGRSLQPCYGTLKAVAVREIAERDGIDLARSTAYSDSHTDIAFLEAVGQPAAVNPDSKLRRIALARGWPILEFSEPLVPGAERRPVSARRPRFAAQRPPAGRAWRDVRRRG
jgi:HAD superfamily hydrolase (TIGR01490 family)